MVTLFCSFFRLIVPHQVRGRGVGGVLGPLAPGLVTEVPKGGSGHASETLYARETTSKNKIATQKNVQ